MKDVYILGIESSCDETSMSILKNNNELLSNSHYCAKSNRYS